MTGDLMAEDPLCTHIPGKFAGSPLLTLRGAASPAPSGEGAPQGSAGAGFAESGGAKPPVPEIQYGAESTATIAWDADAAERMKKIPAFVRGMVVRAVEDSCRRNGLDRVTIEELERIRARMPTPKLFGEARGARPAGAERGEGVPPNDGARGYRER
jgi:hypothetical protein